MAQNLRNKIDPSEKLILYDVNPEAAKSVKGVNTVKASHVGEVGDLSDVVITMLPEGKHVKEVYGQILDSIKSEKSRLFIDSSTCDIKTSLAVGDEIRSKGAGDFVDAPVSGGVIGAMNGTLTFMVGADKNSQVEPILKYMGKNVFQLGKPGAGLAAKLANNYILALTNIATSEGFQLANKLGLNLKQFSDLIATSTGRSWNTEANNPVPGIDPKTPSSRGYENGFGVNLMKKDLLLAIDASNLANLELLLGDRAAEIYQQLSDQGLGNKDMSVVYKTLGEQ